MPESIPVEVMTPEGVREWLLNVLRRDRKWEMSHIGDNQTWTASGPNAFHALRLRADLDRAGVLIGLNGARPNAWPSGMQADMGEGKVIYLHEIGAKGEFPSVGTLDRAPLGSVGTVGQQDDFHTAWRVGRDQGDI